MSVALKKSGATGCLPASANGETTSVFVTRVSAGSHWLMNSQWRQLVGRVAEIPARIAIALVRGYQFLLSPIFGGQCRFHPSCSEYYILSVKKHGALVGSLRGARRILRCHPFHPGGYDPP